VSQTNDDEPAFPVPIDTREGMGPQFRECGMTLRDYFAAQALTGLIARTDSRGKPDDFAGWAYRYADEMLAARGGAS